MNIGQYVKVLKENSLLVNSNEEVFEILVDNLLKVSDLPSIKINHTAEIIKGSRKIPKQYVERVNNPSVTEKIVDRFSISVIKQLSLKVDATCTKLVSILMNDPSVDNGLYSMLTLTIHSFPDVFLVQCFVLSIISNGKTSKSRQIFSKRSLPVSLSGIQSNGRLGIRL